MDRNLSPSKNQLQTDNLISSSSYFEDSSEDEGYLLRNMISNKRNTKKDYFNYDSENEYKTRKPEIIYKTETTHYGRVK
jgi:hypothetical protein